MKRKLAKSKNFIEPIDEKQSITRIIPDKAEVVNEVPSPCTSKGSEKAKSKQLTMLTLFLI